MKLVKKVLFIIVAIILSCLLIFNLYNFINIKVLQKDYATINGYIVLEVVTGSMEPTISIGDLIIVDTKDKALNIDDIITFYDREGSIVTHRIIDISESGVITKGDANNTDDGILRQENVIGKYIKKINGMGRIISSFKSPFTLIMIFIIGVLICIYISTDKTGNPLLTKEEQEFQDYLRIKELQKKGPKHFILKDNTKKKVTKKNSKK